MVHHRGAWPRACGRRTDARRWGFAGLYPGEVLGADKLCHRLADGELDACWGAQVGKPEEILVSGKLKDIVDEIERMR
jgi:hypothetical protein